MTLEEFIKLIEEQKLTSEQIIKLAQEQLTPEQAKTYFYEYLSIDNIEKRYFLNRYKIWVDWRESLIKYKKSAETLGDHEMLKKIENEMTMVDEKIEKFEKELAKLDISNNQVASENKHK